MLAGTKRGQVLHRCAAVLLAAASLCAHAECREDLQRIVDQLSPVATKQAGRRVAPKVEVLSQIGSNLAAYADIPGGRVLAAISVCGYAEPGKRGLMAHELGHFIAHARYPVIAEDAYRPEPRIAPAVHEALADYFAAGLARSVGWYAEVLAVLDVQCGHGSNPRACRSLGAWTTPEDPPDSARSGSESILVTH